MRAKVLVFCKKMRFLRSVLLRSLLLRNLLAMFAVFLLLGWGALYWLDVYTRHDQNVVVPPLRGLSVPETQEELNKLGLEYVIMDSTNYIDSLPKRSVVEQVPSAGWYVKEGRKIYLTINAKDYSDALIPNVFGKTKREAVSHLKNKGFLIGMLEYIPDLGKDILLKLKHKGRQLEVGDTLKKNSEIDLVLGRGLGDARVPVPDLRLLSKKEVKRILQSLSLNVGQVVYDSSLYGADTLSLRVYRQYPVHDKNNLRMGQTVDIWLTADSLKLYRNVP